MPESYGAPIDGYAFHHDVQVRFAETDAQGIAHHAAYLVWLEEARVAWLDTFAGGYAGIRERGIEALTTGVQLEYRAAAAFHDVLRVWTRCGGIRGARFRYDYVVEREGVTVAEGHTSHATVDRVTHRPVRVPDWFAADVVTARSAAPPPRTAP